jgi:hypothetical protein
MQTQESLDAYFTQQIVGSPVRVSLGPSARVRQTSRHGVVIDRISGQASLLRQAGQSLLSSDWTPALSGRPVNRRRLLRVRRALVVIGLLAWTAGVAGLALWWRGGV